MFDVNQAKIGRFARASADNMALVATFVQVTIQNPLHRVPADMKSVKARGRLAPCLWGSKQVAYDWWQEHKAEAFATLQGLWLDPSLSDEEFDREALAYVARLPGFGLAKGGFLLQLCYGRVGCLDTHNIKLYSLNPARFRADRLKRARTHTHRERVVNEYVVTCEAQGGAQRLWDAWCEYVAEANPGFYRDAAEASEIHCRALGL